MNRYRRILVYLSLLFVLVGLIFATCMFYLNEQGNFHTVTKNEMYRSAQLDKDELVYYIKKYKIRSIVNLRRKSNAHWYREELGICKQYGVYHYDYGFSATNILSFKRMKAIILLLKNMPKPVLIHCKAGADRSGLIAALWLYKIQNYPFKKAFKQLSITFGHFPYLGSPTQAMDKSFMEFANK